MKATPDRIDGSSNYPAPSPEPVVTVGNFDGVHRGHVHLLDRTIERAQELGRPSLAYTFFPAPRDVLRPGNPIPRIQTLDDKVASLLAAGIDQVVVEPFTREFGSHTAAWFATEILAGRLGASALVLGWDFRFGKGRAGGVDDLRGWLDIDVEQVEAYAPDGRVISSSRIREAVRAGDVEEAARLLARPHQIVGVVAPGDGRGRDLGYPTANVACQTELVPPPGVYAGYAELQDGRTFQAVINVGYRPHFGAGGDHRFETHVLDFQGDLYGQTLRTHLALRLRDEAAFDSLEALVAQIDADVIEARAHLEPVGGSR